MDVSPRFTCRRLHRYASVLTSAGAILIALMLALPAFSQGGAVGGEGQGGGGTGGAGGGGNTGGQSVGDSGVTSSTINNGSGSSPGGESSQIKCTYTDPDTQVHSCDCVADGNSSITSGDGGASGCNSCGSSGGGGGGGGGNEDAGRRRMDFSAGDVRRYWIPNDRVHNSTLSPGFYTQFDSQIHLFPGESDASIYLFDVIAQRTFKFVDGLDGDTFDGVFQDLNNQHARKIELLNSSGATVTTIAQATTAKLTHWNGAVEKFQLIDLDADEAVTEWAGRLVERTDRNGFGFDIAYKTFTSTELAASPSRQWQIDTITDDWGQSLTFTYNSAQQSGRWAASQVVRNDSATVSFAYSSGALASATFPDGKQTVYTYGQDTTAQTATVRIQEARDSARDLTYHLTNDYITLGTNVISQPTGIRRMIKTQALDVEWMLIPNSDPTIDQNFIFVGGNLAKVQSGNATYQKYNSWQCVGTNGSGSGGQQGMGFGGAFSGIEGELDPQVSGAGTGTTLAQLRTGRLPSSIDSAGRVKEFLYDTDGNVTRVTYPADSTHEDYTYNSFGQVTRKRSRTGDVELFTYDSKGNLLTHSTGLKEVSGTDQQTAAYSQSSKEYFTSGGANAGLLKTEKSALYNASIPTLYRTDYEYDTNNRLTKKIDPAPASGQARPETVYEYNTAGKLTQVTDPLNHVTGFTYDSAGHQTQVTYPDTSTEQTLYGTGVNAGRVVATKNRVGTVTSYSYDSSGRLTQTVVGAAIDANILDGNAYDTTITDSNLKQITEYTYLAGSDSLKSQVKSNGAVTDYTIDFKNRVTEVKQYPRAGVTLTSKKVYAENQLLYDEDAYGRRKYYGYRASDGTLIRTVTCTHPGYTLADFTAVWNLTRSTAANAAYIIHDAIRDDAGHLTQVIDGRGTETRYEYDAQGRETKKTAAYGTSVAAVTETDYDADGRTIEVRSPRYFDSSDTEGYQKAKENWTYDGAGRVATHTEAAGSSVAATESFTYFADGRQQTHTDYRGKVWTNIDDTCCGKSTASKNPLGHGSIRNTDPQRRVVHSVTVSNADTHTANMLDPVNASTMAESTTKYDSLGRTIATTAWLSARGQIDPLSPTIAGLGGVAQSEGLTTQYLYDDNLADGVGLDNSTGVSTAILPASNGSWKVSLATALTKLAAAETAGGAALTFSATSPGRATIVINPEFEVSFTVSDAAGRTVMSGKLDNYTGTANNLLTWSCQAHDTVTAVAGFGNCLESRSIDALGNTTKSLTDGAGRTLRSIDQLGNATVFTYDAGGNQLSVRDPNSVGQDVVYDSLGRAGLITDTANHTTNSTYDKAGNRIAAIDGKSQTTSYKFDPRGRKKSQTDRIAGVTSFAYLATGQLASLTDAESQTTSYTYDDAGGKLTEQYPDHTGGNPGDSSYGIVTFTLDPAGRVSRKQDQKGDTCTFNYDLAGRLSNRQYRAAANSPSGTIADTDQFTYDKAGRMLTAYSGRYNNTVGYSYDSASRKTTESLTIAGQTYTTTTDYNARGELTKYTYPDSTVVDRSYTARGELYQLKHAGTTIDTRAYDNGGRMSSSTLNNGVVDTRAHGADNTLSSITFTGSGTSIGNLSYAWDNNHNKTSETITGTMSNYGFSIPTGGYDGEDCLVSFNRTSGLSQSWSLSAVGDWNSITTNGTAQTRTHGPTHELLTGAASNVSTDVKGNITLIPSSLRPNASSLTSTWDFDNRLTSATTGSGTVSHQYDALGRRVARTSGSSTTVYVQAGQQTIADYASGAAPASSTYRYLYASYIDEPVMRWTTSSSTAVYYHRNQQYSVTALTDSSGAVLERYAYTAYGVPTIANASGGVLSSSGQNNRYTYTGREWDNDIQQYHYRARMFDPALGRFCSRDPMRYTRTFSLFASDFVLIRTDPLGWFGLDIEDLKKDCQEVNDRRKKHNPKDVPPLDPGKAEGCAKKVQERIDKLKEDEKGKLIIGQFSKDCPMPKVTCQCCPSGFGGFYSRKDKMLWLCADKDGNLGNNIDPIIIHELVHALQDCFWKGKEGCERSLKWELEAYFCMGGACTDFDSCISRAIQSSCWGSCTPADVETLIPSLKTWFENTVSSGDMCKFPRGSDYPTPKRSK
ncbi:MAG: RHS repeat-associated core domain-containing protein [Pirellulales bacterium]